MNKITDKQMAEAEKRIKAFECMIQSMTAQVPTCLCHYQSCAIHRHGATAVHIGFRSTVICRCHSATAALQPDK